MNILHQYTPEIMAISKANNNASYRDAAQMFLNNIDDAGHVEDQYHYPGADHVDYAALRELVPPKESQERNDMEAEWLADVEKKIETIMPLFKHGKTESIRDVMMTE